MKARLAVIAIIITTIISGCSKNNDCKDGDCEKNVLINKQLYDNTVTNNELCAAAFGKTVSFNLKPLRVKGSHKISIFLSGLNNPIIYSY